ncbi:MAG: hypothetical protein ABFR32_02570 [Bacteroidota bacterium]
MKKILPILLSVSLLFVSCVSEIGPPGPPGQDGINIMGQIFEAQVNFNDSNNYEVLIDFPSNIEVYDTDVVMAYILSGVDNGVDIWEPLPQTLFFEDGILLYGFNHTYADIQFFLDGTVYLDDLSTQFTQDIIFRVAIIPAESAQGLNLDNLDSVLNSLQNQEIIRLN